MICPYCECEITMSQVDAEDGYCPECGSVIAASAIFMEDEEDDLNEEELDLDDFEEVKDFKELDDDF